MKFMSEIIIKQIIDYLKKSQNLTFLIGAGCSVDTPSCLPVGRVMLEEIIRYACDPNEIKNILELEDLRFESLIEIIQNLFDKELKVIDYYAQCDKPNIIHFFLADSIIKGNIILTTNFDLLIEQALIQLNIPKEKIIPIITVDDFNIYSRPNELIQKNKYPIYKIHGSTNNIITNVDTHSSLIVTLQKLGANKEGLNLFQIESYKKPLFDNVMDGRSLVVMGYSGSDDFDVIPTLKTIEYSEKIIWINHSENKEEIIEIESDSTIESPIIENVINLLKTIKHKNPSVHIILINGDTKQIIEKILLNRPVIDSKNFSLSPKEWFKINFGDLNEYVKITIPYRIYIYYNMYNDALRCAEKIYLNAEKSEDNYWKAFALNIIGRIKSAKGEHDEAIEKLISSLKIYEDMDNLIKNWKANCINNLANAYHEKGEINEALKFYNRAKQLSEELNDLTGKCVLSNNLASIYYQQGKINEAINNQEESINIAEKLGYMNEKSYYLQNLGEMLKNKENYVQAVEKFKEAYQIAVHLSNEYIKIAILSNIAAIYDKFQCDFIARRIWQKSYQKLQDMGLSDSKIAVTIRNNLENLQRKKLSLH